ncbi:MAG TPA: hypothetical protein VMT87_07350 [Vicinamibacteria bacterium]|nr:hypothetical protein [Vicinamibacteria bacterium]
MRTVILAGSFSLPALTVANAAFAAPSTGTVDITVDWTFPASPIGVYVVRGACALDQFNARACDFLTRSESGQKPRTITLPNVAAGSYVLMLANFGEEDESLSILIGHTTGGGASSARDDGGGVRDRDPRFSRAVESLVRN